jgi:hypothetical protein
MNSIEICPKCNNYQIDSRRICPQCGFVPNPAESGIYQFMARLPVLREKAAVCDDNANFEFSGQMIRSLLAFIDHREAGIAKLKEKIIARYILENGLERCEFDDDCDYCKSPEGGTWASIIHGDVAEAQYYICKKCICQKAGV